MSRFWQHRDTGVLFSAPDETEHAGTCEELTEAEYRRRRWEKDNVSWETAHNLVAPRGLDLFGGDA